MGPGVSTLAIVEVYPGALRQNRAGGHALQIEKQGRGFPTTSRICRAKPVFDTRLSESRVSAGNERSLAHFNAVVALQFGAVSFLLSSGAKIGRSGWTGQGFGKYPEQPRVQYILPREAYLATPTFAKTISSCL